MSSLPEPQRQWNPQASDEALITQVSQEPPADQESTTAGLIELQLVQTPRSSSPTTSECAAAPSLRKETISLESTTTSEIKSCQTTKQLHAGANSS
jgi:hypothetical protein